VSRPRRVVILGSTGSIGCQTLDVIRRLREAGQLWEIAGLAAGRNVERLAEQVAEFTPTLVSVADAAAAAALSRQRPRQSVVHGEDGLLEVVTSGDAELVVNALVGAMGLAPTLHALDRGCTVALANKETLVVGGELVRERLNAGCGALVPIDSELNALWQCLRAGAPQEVERVVLTASGGPLLHLPPGELDSVTPDAVLAHPAWRMGRRVTVDSATMVNKALEVIEAHFLFDLPYERIDAIVHPQAVVHGMVEFLDGAWIAHLAPADMRLPIAHAITDAKRHNLSLPRVGPGALDGLRFLPLESRRFPGFGHVLRAARNGALARAVANAADEVLVDRFLGGGIGFTGIADGLDRVVSEWLASHASDVAERPTVDALLAADSWARRFAGAYASP